MTNFPCRRSWLCWLTFACLLAPLAAQSPAGGRDDLIAVSAQARALETVDGVLWAGGAHYKARLSADGVCFVPALGRKSERTRELDFELLATGRADGPTTAAAAVAPEASDFAVRYVRPDCVETYAVLAEGLEQSFVFAERPAGSGDLLVRGRLRTDLPLSRADDGSLRFVDPVVGGVVLRDVVGTDAGGRRVRGSMRCAPETPGTWTLELSLPAAFVDAASLPLVLDPFLGATLVPGAGPDDTYCDVAYEPTTDTYLFVWDRSFSMFSTDLVGQRLSGTGTLIGSLITVRQNVNGLASNRVVAVDARDTFLITWWETLIQSDVLVASVHAATGAVSSVLLIGPGLFPDLSVPTSQDPGALVSWQDTVAGGISATRVNIAPGGALSIGPGQRLSRTGLGPLVPRGGGVAGRMLVAWYDQGGVHGAVVDGNAQVLAAGLLFASPALPMRLDGDDSQWIIVWDTAAGINSDVHCRRVTFDPGAMTLAVGPQIAIANLPGIVEQNVCVAWLGGVAAIGYVIVTGLGTPNSTATPFVKTIDGFACTQCAPDVSPVAGPVGVYVQVARLAARKGSNGMASEAIFTCVAGTSGTASVLAWRFRSDDGLEWDRGGGCGGGRAAHGCAVPGNAGYSFRLDAAPPQAPAFLVLGTQAANQTCGACTLVPDPATGVALYVGLTSTGGAASQAMPVPLSSSLTGFRYFGQWVSWSSGGCTGFALSNALEVQLQ